MIKRMLTGWLICSLLSTTVCAQSNPELKVANGHREYVQYGCASSDERLLATSGSDGMIIWDLASGLELRSFKRNLRPEIPFTIPGSGDIGSIHDGVIRRYNGQNLQERILANLTLYFLVKGVAVDPSGRYVYIGAHRYDAERCAVLYQADLQTGYVRLIRQVTASAVGITNADFTTTLEFNNLSISPDGKKISARLECPKGNVRFNYSFFDTQTLQPVNEFNAPGQLLGFLTNDLLWHIGDKIPGTTVATQSKMPKINLINYPAMSYHKSINTPTGGITTPVPSSSQQLDLAAGKWYLGSRYGFTTVDLNKFTSDTRTIDTTTTYKPMVSILLPVSRQLIHSAPDGALAKIDSVSGDKKPLGGGKPLAPSYMFANRKRPIVSLYSSTNRTVQFIDMRNEGIRVYNHTPSDYLSSGVVWSPDGKTAIALGNYNGKIFVWNADRPEQAPVIKNTAGYFCGDGIAWAPDSKTFATAGTSIIIWDAATMQQIRSFPGHVKFLQTYWRNVAEFSPDGNKLAVVKVRPNPSDNNQAVNQLVCHDVKTGAILWEKTFPYPSRIDAITFDKSGQLQAFSKTTHTTYEAATGQAISSRTIPELGTYPEPTPDASAMAGYNKSGIVIVPLQSGVAPYIIPSSPNGSGLVSFTSLPGFALALNTDNSLHLIDMERRVDAGRLYTFANSTEFAFLNSNNYFEGSESATASMYFVKDSRILPLQSLFEKFYTPKLLQRVFSRSEPGPPVVNINTIKAAPTATISYVAGQRNLEVDDDIPVKSNTVKQSSISISVQATAPGDQIAEIRLYQNGKLIANNTRGLIVEDDEGLDKRTYSVILQPGVNQFTAVSINSQRTESMPAQLSLTYTTPKTGTAEPGKTETAGKPTPPAPATMHLLVIGINQYKNPRYNLNYALADAKGFQEKLNINCGKLVQKCQPYFISNAEATRDNITKALKTIASEANPQDLLVFYYAGHGVMNEGAQKEFYLVPHDVTQLYGNDDGLAVKGISSAELLKLSTAIKAQKQLFVLDACQSAGALQQVAMRGAAEEKAIAQLARSSGTHWLTASGSDQFASEFDKLGHGAFTYTLIKGLEGEAATAAGTITVNSLKAYIEVKVPEITEKFKGTPQYPASYGYGNDFPIGTK